MTRTPRRHSHAANRSHAPAGAHSSRRRRRLGPAWFATSAGVAAVIGLGLTSAFTGGQPQTVGTQLDSWFTHVARPDSGNRASGTGHVGRSWRHPAASGRHGHYSVSAAGEAAMTAGAAGAQASVVADPGAVAESATDTLSPPASSSSATAAPGLTASSSSATDTLSPPASSSSATAVPGLTASSSSVTEPVPSSRVSSNLRAPADTSSPSPSVAAGDPGSPKPPINGVGSGTWLSGASGDGVANGQFASWRGSPVTVAGTWADSDQAQVQLGQLHSGGEYGSWNQSIDVAIGAIDNGETWAAAAKGSYDARWRQSLTNLRDTWGSRSGTVFIRFAHEMNGNWYPWSVNAGNYQDFVTAWKRFRTLQQQVFPASKLVFCVNRESVGSGVDWRKTFPGSQYVDVLGVDYYNHYPYVANPGDWNASVNQTDGAGAPKGLQAYLDFARSAGVPLSVPEWSNVADAGDSPAFVDAMHDFFQSHAGSQAGQLLYEIQFNVVSQNNAKFSLFGTTNMPASAAEYRKVF